MLMDILHVMIGNVQGGLIDLLVFGVLKGADTKWYFAALLGLIYIPVYYFSFRFIIEKLDLKTPGREDDTGQAIVTGNSDDELSNTIIAGLGGKANIESVDNCFTRLRVVVSDTDKVDEALLRTTGCSGVVKAGGGNIQIIYGPKVEAITGSVKQAMATA